MIGTKRHIKSIRNCQSWKLENHFQSLSSMFMQFHPFPIRVGLRSLPLDVALAATRLPEFVASCQAALQTWIVIVYLLKDEVSNASMDADAHWIHHPKLPNHFKHLKPHGMIDALPRSGSIAGWSSTHPRLLAVEAVGASPHAIAQAPGEAAR